MLAILNAFSGGVFFSIAIIHILPEQAEGWYNYDDFSKKTVPLPYAMVFVGYTLILVIDKILFNGEG